MKLGSIWESGAPSSDIYALMFLCYSLSCAVESSGKNLWRALAVSLSDVVTDPSGKVSDEVLVALQSQLCKFCTFSKA